MIKQILVVGLLILLLSACKKYHTCQCLTTIKYWSSTTGTINTVTAEGNKVQYSEKLSRKKAESACKHEETAIQTNVNSWETYNGAYVLKPGESTITTCTLD